MIIAGEKSGFKIGKSIVFEGSTNLVGETHDEMFVVNAGEDFAGDFVGFEEMMQISSRVIFTTFTVAFGHGWGKIVTETGVANMHT